MRTALYRASLLTLACFTVLTSCKIRDNINSTKYDAPGEDADFEELALTVMWVDANGHRATNFMVTDVAGKRYLASPGNVHFIEKTGTVTAPLTPGEFIPLGNSQQDDVPTIDLDLTITSSLDGTAVKRYQWCHTKVGVAIGAPGKVRCYRQDSERGRFVQSCLAAKGKLRVDRDRLACESLGAHKLGDYTFNFGAGDNQDTNIASLAGFRTLQEFCAQNKSYGTDALNLDSLSPRQCVCTDLASKATKAYDLWQVANFFNQKGSANWTRDFLNICAQHQSIPQVSPPSTSSDTGSAVLTLQQDQIKINSAICQKLRSMGFADAQQPSTDYCPCPSYSAPGAMGPAARNLVPLATTSERFIEQCFALDLTSSYPEVCDRIDMTFNGDMTNGPLNRGLCKAATGLQGAAPKECEIIFTKPKADFIDHCLQLTSTILGSGNQSPLAPNPTPANP